MSRTTLVCLLSLIVIGLPIVNIAYQIPQVFTFYLVASTTLFAALVTLLRMGTDTRGE